VGGRESVGLEGRPLDGLGLRPSIGLDGVAWRLVLPCDQRSVGCYQQPGTVLPSLQHLLGRGLAIGASTCDQRTVGCYQQPGTGLTGECHEPEEESARWSSDQKEWSYHVEDR
jgi:hypothetical protein